MEIVPSSPDELVPAVSALQQSAGYAHALNYMGARTQAFAIRSGADVFGQCVMINRRIGPLNLFWLPRGPVWFANSEAVLRHEAIRHISRALPGKHLLVTMPDRPRDLKTPGYRVLVTPQHVAEIDLRRDHAEQLAAQHGKWRNRLRHAGKSGLRTRHRAFCPDRDAALLDLEARQRRQRRYRALPVGFASAWARVNTGATRLFTVFRGETPVAHMLLLLHTPVATYHIGWISAEGRRFSAHNLALWEAQRYLSGRGFQRFDLGSVDTENAPDLARFKIGTGARVRPLGPTCLLTPAIFRRQRICHDAA